MINVIPLMMVATFVYMVLLAGHLKQRRVLEEHFLFTVFFIYMVGGLSVCFFPVPFQRELLLSMQHQPWHQSYMSWNPIRSLYLIVTHDPLHDIVYTIGGNLVSGNVASH